MTQPEVLARIWEALHSASTQRTGFTLAHLATVTADGQPRGRSVILREFLTGPERVCFATDARAAKIVEIRQRPRVALTFYDAAASVQLRAEGLATIVEHAAARERAWHTLAPHSQELYAGAAVPGTPFDAEVVSDDRLAFERFAWVSVQLARLDWLDLSAEPRQRWQFQLEAHRWAGHRVVP